MSQAQKSDRISRVIAEGTPIHEAAVRGVRRAMAVHKRLGQSVVTWRDGKVVILSPEEIPVGIEEFEHPLSRPPADDADPVR